MEESFQLIEFYGAECSHCRSIEPLIARLQDEVAVVVDVLLSDVTVGNRYNHLQAVLGRHTTVGGIVSVVTIY